MKSLAGKKLGIIHATLVSTQAVKRYIDELLSEVEVVHYVDETIHNTNFAAGPGCIPPKNFAKFVQAAQSQQDYGVDAILLACSTFNRAVEYAQPMLSTRLVQIDRPMMDLAVGQGQRIGLLATVSTTVPTSERLLHLAATDAGKSIQVNTRLCSQAFQALKAGDLEKHNKLLLAEIDRLSDEVDVIVMAQVSMSVLESRLSNTKVPVLNSGRTSFNFLRELLSQ